jgi:hypothetical protein
MALIECYECGKSISTHAAACPQCGAPAESSPPVIALESPPPIPRTQTNEDDILYRDSYVSVTSTRLIIGSTTYALRNITSVRMSVTPPNNTGAVLLMLLGILGGIIGGNIGFMQNTQYGVMCIVAAVVTVALSIIWMVKTKSDYHLGIASSSGEVNALTSTQEYIGTIVEKINEAIVRYR